MCKYVKDNVAKLMMFSIFAARLDVQSIVLDCSDLGELLNYLHRRCRVKSYEELHSEKKICKLSLIFIMRGKVFETGFCVSVILSEIWFVGIHTISKTYFILDIIRKRIWEELAQSSGVFLGLNQHAEVHSVSIEHVYLSTKMFLQ